MSLSGHLTGKQIEILTLVQKGAPDGDFLDMDQLHESLSYACSKQALQCSIRHLESRGYVERRPTELRRGRKRRVVTLTHAAQTQFQIGSGAFDVIFEDEDNI